MMGCLVGILGGVGRTAPGAWIDLGSCSGEEVLSLGMGMRELEGEAGECKEGVIVPEVLHLQQQSKIKKSNIYIDLYLHKNR